MNSLKVSALTRLALHCGYAGGTTKAARVLACSRAAAVAQRVLASQPPGPLNVLSVDVGLKNFSYCKVSYAGGHADVREWSHLNLHEQYGHLHGAKFRAEQLDGAESGECDGLGGPGEQKAYLASLALAVVDSVFAAPAWVPHVITIENQRTRSAANKVTLPNVLLNFTLEHMMYAAFAARQTTNAALANTLVVPVHANKMVGFWISRFLAANAKFSGAKSKVYRTQLVHGWLARPEHSPFSLSLSGRLPADFAALSYRKRNNAVLDVVDALQRPKKVDDLVDCLLYNLQYAMELQHHLQLQEALVRDGDIPTLIDEWDTQHCSYLEPLLAETPLELAHA